jgi:hypothetical protein
LLTRNKACAVSKIGERGLIVYGPNGVGKSSIIDAIEATIHGAGRIDDVA